MQALAFPDPGRPQSLSAHSALPCRHIVNRATPPVTRSMQRPERLFCLALFAAQAALCLYVLAGAAL